jgi:hypothetical protein
MGGAGSGRYSSYPTTVEDYRAIAIGSLVRKGLLRPGYGWTTTWSRDGEVTGSISGRTERDAVVLSYRVRDRSGGAWENVEQRIRLDYTPQHFGEHEPGFGARRAIAGAASSTAASDSIVGNVGLCPTRASMRGVEAGC